MGAGEPAAQGPSLKIGPAIRNRISEAEARQQKLSAGGGGVVQADLADPDFLVQLALLNDECHMLAVLCTRRAAKTFSLAKRLVRAMIKHPGCSCLYITLTDETAERILWKDVLRVIDRRWKLGGTYLSSKMTYTLPNGSVLYLLGMDRDEEERNKLLGGKYAEVAIDEAQAFTTDLGKLVFDVLKPAVADYRGTIGLYGTPGNVKVGLFYELTKDQNPTTPHRFTKLGFSGHTWNTFANPYMADKWREEIADLKTANPLIEETPGFQQNYLGLWVIDDTLLVYRYRPGRNDYDGTLPVFPRGDWHSTLTIDLGFVDATSFTTGSYHDHSRDLFFEESYKRPGMDITAVGLEAKRLKAKHEGLGRPIQTVIIDGANAQAVAELNNRHELGAIAADKTGKSDFIDIMNAEFIQGRIKLSPACQPLREELTTLVWDEKKLKLGKREEHPACENHCTDGALYDWRHCYPYLSRELPVRAAPGTVEALQEQQREQQAELEAMVERDIAEHQQQQDEERELSEWG